VGTTARALKSRLRMGEAAITLVRGCMGSCVHACVSL
jgi:hypothetical protein